MKKLFFIMLLAAAGAGTTAYAQSPRVVVSDKAGWHKIGETTVDFKKERDEISVLGADKFKAIKFRVEDEPIDLVEAYVVFDNKEEQRATINSHVKAPGDSREINITGGERNIKKVGFVYKTLPNPAAKKAHVEIWGLKTNSDTN